MVVHAPDSQEAELRGVIVAFDHRCVRICWLPPQEFADGVPDVGRWNVVEELDD